MKSDVKANKLNSKYSDTDENIYLCNCIFGDGYKKELKEMNKHEIISKMAEMLGSSPCELVKAEKIFNRMKYMIADYIIHHEYNSQKGISMDLITWLDSQADPNRSKRLNKFISRFLK
jgi:hypothetical protein